VFPSVSRSQVFPGWYRWCYIPRLTRFCSINLPKKWIQKPGNLDWIEKIYPLVI
jgi:hypothetical protein